MAQFPESGRGAGLTQPARRPGKDRPLGTTTTQASAGAATPAEQVPEGGHSGQHAFLHDFCMAIPFGAIIILAGAVSLFFQSGRAGLALMAAGGVMEVLAGLSLANWKQGKGAGLFTMGSAGVALGLMRYFWQRAQLWVAPWATYLLCALSAAMSLFLIYNVAAGGNPPKKPDAKTG